MKNELMNGKYLILLSIKLAVHIFIFTDLKYVPYNEANSLGQHALIVIHKSFGYIPDEYNGYSNRREALLNKRIKAH
jgi:hypothetical protein